MKNLLHKIYLFVLLLFFGTTGYAQLYPVQLSPIFNSPYSVKISEYATSMDTKMQLLINPNDITISQRQVRLKLYIQGNGINIQSTDFIQGQRPIFINGGELQTLTNTDIAALFRLENLQGISPAQYANALPEGMYNFCFEMYDFVTNQKISQKSCASLYLILNDPPLLNTPQRNEQIASTDFPNILFTWTPRQINATNISYKFELKQLLDPTLDPQIGFQMSPVLYEETLFGTALLYNVSMPILTPGMRYAWRVRAISTTGLSENAVFKNDGYSEIYSFKYTASCAAPTFLLSEAQGNKSVKITWEGIPEHTRYQLQYKKQDVANAKWFSSYSLNTQSLITDLEPGVTYQFRVGSSCDPVSEGVQSFTYSGISTFTTPTQANGVPAYNCGIIPKINIENQKPLDNLIQSETFKAGDFPVTVLELEKEHSPYSGRGYIIVPYLADTKIAVEFKNILINTDYQLISGVVETSYNPDWKNVVDVEDFTGSGPDGNVKETVPFEISDIVINPNGDILVNGKNGEQITIPGGKNTVITDSKGTVYHVDKNGNGTNAGELAAAAGKPTPANTDGVDNNGKVTSFTAKGVTVAFSSGGKYAFDVLPPNAAANIEKLYKKVDGVALPYKAVANGDTDTVIAVVTLTDEEIKLKDIVFKTENGAAIKADLSDNTFVLTVKGSMAYGQEEILATIKQGDKWKVIGAFVLVHLTPREVNVALVPLDNDVSASTLDEISANTQAIYNKVAIKINFDRKSALNISKIVSDKTIQTEKNTLTSTYSSQQQSINNEYLTIYKSEAPTYVLFVTNNTSSTGQQGYMRLNGQFGYVFKSGLEKIPVKIAAHELGHGIFKLEHPFEVYKTPSESTDLLMDYSSGTVLNHQDWKQINDPAFKLYAFQSQASGEFANYVVTPDYKIASLPVPNSLIYDACNFDNTKKGLIYGFSEEGKRYCWNKDAYYDGTTKYKGKIEYISNPKDTDKIVLFFDIERPCPSKELTVSYLQIKNKLNTDELNKFIEENLNNAKNVPCGNDKEAFTSSFFDIASMDVPPGVKVDRIDGGKFSNEQIQKTISQVNRLILKNNSSYGYNTEMTNSDLGNIFVDENIPAGGDKLNRLDHSLVYLSDFSKQKNNQVNIYVVYTKVDYLISGNWNEYTKQVFEASNLKDKNAILITVPYFNLKKSTNFTDFAVDHFMPGLYAKGLDINTNAITKIKANNTRIETTGVVGTYQSILNTQVEEFIGQVYKQTYKPSVIYLGLRYANGTIPVDKIESPEYKSGYNFVKTVLLKDNIYFNKIANLPIPKIVYTNIPGSGAVNPYYEEEILKYAMDKAELLDKANSSTDPKDWIDFENSVDFKEKQLEESIANKYITGYAFKDGFSQWTNDVTVVFPSTSETPPIYEFTNVYNKDKWSTLDPVVYGIIDASSIALSFVAADAIPEAIGLMYAVSRKDVLSSALYSSAIVLPVIASGELRAGQKLANKLAKDSKIFFRGAIYTLNAEGKLSKISTSYTRGRLIEFFRLSEKAVTPAELDAFAKAFKEGKIGNSKIKEILNETDDLKRLTKFKKVKELSDLWQAFFDDVTVSAIKKEVISSNLASRFPNLTIDELTAIKVYTSDKLRNGSKIYQTLNNELRTGNLSNFNTALNDLLNNGLSKLESHSGNVYRGVYGAEADLARTWKVGDEVPFKDFKSSSTSKQVAAYDFSYVKGDEIIFEIKGANGANICGISCLPNEMEVLLKSNLKFKVIEIDPNHMIFDKNFEYSNKFTKILIELIP
ncbi:ADP-ribosyltransferase domain-containing protein [Flavobacterium sp. 245]|uniref:ADP-ribosyltransferase domain-containing protein n=1 Tax=Flavobacterium sp. 245 TaxID=2512115 RepID=UPI00105C49FA|nr:ADP-ribosyltransferase domain-containing protein [Flavobacterium sp. 245]TDO94890.1 NAD:arginine ADP-ribosyltransferase [Flavobacterium sp. 245]